MKRKILASCFLFGIMAWGQSYAGDGSAIGDKQPPSPPDRKEKSGGFEWPDLKDIFKRR